MSRDVGRSKKSCNNQDSVWGGEGKASSAKWRQLFREILTANLGKIFDCFEV